jgi:hypothetical protein
MEKGISPIISVVLLTLVLITAIYLVLNIIKPTLDRAFESAAMNEADQNMRLLDNLIREVASEGIGSFRTVVLKVSDGDYRIVNTSGNFTGAIQYKIDLKYSPYTAPMLKNVMNIKYTAGINSIGLVGYWKNDEGNGTIAKDFSGYNNDGALRNGTIYSWQECYGGNCPNWVSGKYGNAIKFDGSNDYLYCNNNTVLNPTTAITIEAWVNISNYAASGKWPGIVGKGNNVQYQIYLEQSSSQIVGSVYNSTSYKSCTFSNYGNVSLNTWHHIVMTYDSVTGKINTYLNGVLNSTCSHSGNLAITIEPVYIGLKPNDYFNGTIDEVKIYNRALSADEVKENYNAKASNYQVALEYNKIILTGNLKLGKGTHKLCIEKIGELNNKPLLKITAC